MRARQDTDGRSHDALTTTPGDHHAAPALVSFSNTTQSVAAGATYDLDVTLPSAVLKVARIQLMGPATSGGGVGSGKWRECASVHATTSSSEAMGHSAVTPSGSGFKRSYCSTYSKWQGDSQLTEKVFDTITTPTAAYISLQDAWITGSTLRLRFKNHRAAAATLWVKGSALLW